MDKVIIIYQFVECRTTYAPLNLMPLNILECHSNLKAVKKKEKKKEKAVNEYRKSNMQVWSPPLTTTTGIS